VNQGQRSRHKALSGGEEIVGSRPHCLGFGPIDAGPPR
jgi:hypothetical protein